MLEVIGALVGREGLEDFADRVAEGSGGGLAQGAFELGENLFDRVEVGRIFGEKEDARRLF